MFINNHTFKLIFYLNHVIKMAVMGWKFGGVILAFQVLFIILFGVFGEYGESANAGFYKNSRKLSKGGADPENNEIKHYYPSKSFYYLITFYFIFKFKNLIFLMW